MFTEIVIAHVRRIVKEKTGNSSEYFSDFEKTRFTSSCKLSPKNIYIHVYNVVRYRKASCRENCRTAWQNWQFCIFPAKPLSDKCPVIFSKENNVLTINMPLVLQILICPARDYSLSEAGLGGSVGCAVRLETRKSRVQPPPRSATFFHGDWSWNIFYGHSLPSADSRRAVVSFWRKNVHSTG